MARNIEIKARISELVTLRAHVAAMSARGSEVLIQRDTFYKVPEGRLKLREFSDGKTELIYYERCDRAGPKKSIYTRTPVLASMSMRELLGRLFILRGVVTKRRELFLVGKTRIHLDEV